MAAATYPKVGKRGTGRRKEAVARARLVPGSGKIFVNGKTLDEAFGNRKALHLPVYQPLVAAGVEDDFDVLARSHGGGISGQAQALRLAIARALIEVNPDNHTIMRKEGFLTVDARVKERKKYGQKRARKRFQYSKR